MAGGCSTAHGAAETGQGEVGRPSPEERRALRIRLLIPALVVGRGRKAENYVSQTSLQLRTWMWFRSYQSEERPQEQGLELCGGRPDRATCSGARARWGPGDGGLVSASRVGRLLFLAGQPLSAELWFCELFLEIHCIVSFFQGF